MAELRATCERLNHVQAEMGQLGLTYQELKNSVDQRLKWALGANPALKEIVEGFDGEHQSQLDVSRQLSTLIKSIIGVSQSALQFEALR